MLGWWLRLRLAGSCWYLHLLLSRLQPASTALPGLGEECSNYLSAKNFSSVEDLARALQGEPLNMPCTENQTLQLEFAPDPEPKIPGALNTSAYGCKYGHPELQEKSGVCCGFRPHFNWILGTCENTQETGVFCQGMPQCVVEGSPKINYVATYQFDGEKFVIMEDSSVGRLSEEGISGNFWNKTGWSESKSAFRWRGSDWTTKYAPWAAGVKGSEGPRGVTPPAGLWVLSAENFYYGAFFMLSQLGINLEGKEYPTGTNCWTWEFDPIEGTKAWSPDQPLPGNLNMLYSTDTAQASGCMPVAYTSTQLNGGRTNFTFPKAWRGFCEEHPQAYGCNTTETLFWSGGAESTHRFENLWDEPYVFAVVMDAKGFWVYRWRPAVWGAPRAKEQRSAKRDASCGSHENLACNGLEGDCCPASNGKHHSCCGIRNTGFQTGWPGLERFRAARTVVRAPAKVQDKRGLVTDVPGMVPEALIHHPAVTSEAACLRALHEQVDWQFGSNALGSMREELERAAQSGIGGLSPPSSFEGAHNWWELFYDTWQNQDYPLSVAGAPMSSLQYVLTCNSPDEFTCTCQADRSGSSRSPAAWMFLFLSGALCVAVSSALALLLGRRRNWCKFPYQQVLDEQDRRLLRNAPRLNGTPEPT